MTAVAGDPADGLDALMRSVGTSTSAAVAIAFTTLIPKRTGAAESP